MPETTRVRVLQLMRVAPRTRREVATALGLTYECVHAQFVTLSRQGFIEPAEALMHDGMGAPYRRWRRIVQWSCYTKS